jgi:menaquinone-dependent protoporphyrinogen oxidase
MSNLNAAFLNPFKGETMKTLKKIQYFICALSACMALLCMAAMPAHAEPRTPDDNIALSCGAGAAKKILIAYDTIHGSTGEVAARIGNDLCDNGFAVDVKWVGDVTSVDGYDGFIVGSALYEFSWLDGAKNFLETHKGLFAVKPTAVFVVGASMMHDTAETRAAVQKAFVDPVLSKYPDMNLVLPSGLFGGGFDFTKEQYNLFERIVLRILAFILFLPDWNKADWRSWTAIDDWAADIAGKMK